MSEEYEIFEAWVQKYENQINAGEEVLVPLKNLDTFFKLAARAKIAKTNEGLKDAIPLRVVTDMGEKREGMFIQVIEEIDISEVGSIETGGTREMT